MGADSGRVAKLLELLHTMDPSVVQDEGPFTPEERDAALQAFAATIEVEVEQSAAREPVWEIFASHMAAGIRTFPAIFKALSDDERAVVEAYVEAGHELFWLKMPGDDQKGTTE